MSELEISSFVHLGWKRKAGRGPLSNFSKSPIPNPSPQENGDLNQLDLLQFSENISDIRFLQNHIMRSAFDDAGGRYQGDFGILFQFRNSNGTATAHG
jgi:hypothetical protein